MEVTWVVSWKSKMAASSSSSRGGGGVELEEILKDM